MIPHLKAWHCWDVGVYVTTTCRPWFWFTTLLILFFVSMEKHLTFILSTNIGKKTFTPIFHMSILFYSTNECKEAKIKTTETWNFSANQSNFSFRYIKKLIKNCRYVYLMHFKLNRKVKFISYENYINFLVDIDMKKVLKICYR